MLSDRLAAWSEKLAGEDSGRVTILAEREPELVGFVHVVFGADQGWGALVHNLHVSHADQRSGIGAELMRRAADAVRERSPGGGIYLWVLEQNLRGQAFYTALGGVEVERGPVDPPGGVPGRLAGEPVKLRIAWSDAARLSAAAAQIWRSRASARS